MKLKTQNSKLKIIIFFLSVVAICIGIILFAFWCYNRAKEATIALVAPKIVKVGEEIKIPVEINTAGESINAAVYLKFDSNNLEVISLYKDDSIFELWVTDEPKYSNEKGEISFAGGLPTPGFSGIGQIGVIGLQAKKQGDFTIEFDKKSRALLNDGYGTEIGLRLDPITIRARK
jgi:hypothetical protein